MKTAYWFSARARKDFLGIIQYIADDNPRAAERFHIQLQATCTLITDMPDIGVPVEYIRQRDVRSFHVKQFSKYKIFYRKGREGVEIIRVAHGARDLPALFRS